MKVSAIIPVYNAEKTLRRAVSSLLIQPEISEIILVEDGSRDSSLSLCRELAESNPIIQTHCHPNGENRGAPASRNLGLKYASNRWIQFMDADDELLPGKIADQLQVIAGDESLVVGKMIRVTEHEEILVKPLKDLWSGLLSTRLGITSANLWNAEVIHQVGDWNESLVNIQEYNLMLEIFKVNDKVAFSPRALCKIHEYDDSITNSEDCQQLKRDNYFHFRAKVRDYLVDKGMYNWRRKHIYLICTGNMLRYHQPGFFVQRNDGYYRMYRFLQQLSKWRPGKSRPALT